MPLLHAEHGFQSVGPRSLYPRSEPATQRDIPLVMRDAIQHVATGKRLLDVKPRIIGGDPAPVGAYPWIASIGLKGIDPQDGHFCGGAFIAPEWVLTAAHCVKTDSAGGIQIRGGSNTLERSGAVYLADRVIVHENYDTGTQDNDVALIHLAQPYTGRTIPLLPVAEAERLTAPGSLAVVAGWGLTAEGAQVSSVLRHVTVQIVSNKTCNGLAAYGGSITDVMLCAGFPEGGKDSCQGDSGGPLMVSDQAGNYYQAGIVSWGEGCGRPNKFGVYTRLSVVESWVADKIGGARVAARQPAQSAPSAQAQPAPSVQPSAQTQPSAQARPPTSRRAAKPPVIGGRAAAQKRAVTPSRVYRQRRTPPPGAALWHKREVWVTVPMPPPRPLLLDARAQSSPALEIIRR